MRLREAQIALADWIRGPEGVARALVEEDAKRRDARPGTARRRLESLIRSDEVLDATRRLEIYANAYFHRILGVLSIDYPVLRAALGADLFHDLITSYLLVEPSRHPSIRHAGLRLGDFLANHEAVASIRERAPWAADLAAFEWARVDMFDAADRPVLAASRLASLPPEDFASLSLRLGPWVSFRAYDHPVDRLWAVGIREAGIASLEAADEIISGNRRTGEEARPTLLVWRKTERVLHRRLDEAETGALAQTSLGIRFDALCEWAADEIGESEAPARAAGWLARWVDEGLLEADA